ncbi:MAG TPA: sulfate adenylyltransferase subunit CysD [Terriglobales bacterium]|nr:sulfate adenylyltransferase subunit CysD [Terriglobales bacterium]
MPRQNHLRQLESDAIHILREVAGQFERPVALFSGGKDSITLAWLARKAFAPGISPLPLLHIDTGHNFPETLAYRDWFVQRYGARLVVRSVQDTIDRGRAVEEAGPFASRNALQSITLLDALRELGADCAVGGGRRDEEKARAKERIFSHRDAFGQWDPKHQRPELWSLYNGRRNPGEHFRVFPLSNWTELDVWQYIAREGIALPSLYFAHRRRVFEREGLLLAETPFVALGGGEVPEERTVRFRTVGDATCTAAIESDAARIEDILLETAAARVTERGGRLDDQRSDAAMEDRKRQGYF